MYDLIPVFPDRSYLQISVLLDNPSNCPECYAHKTSLIVMSENIFQKPRYLITCGQCNFRGPFGRHIRDAVDQWNKPPSFFIKFLRRRNRKRGIQRRQFALQQSLDTSRIFPQQF